MTTTRDIEDPVVRSVQQLAHALEKAAVNLGNQAVVRQALHEAAHSCEELTRALAKERAPRPEGA